ncbi:MAG: CvpA family protein [Chitinivibrionales bacterium]
MHPFDIVALSLILIFTVIGLTRGFVSELFRLAAIIAGFIGALMSYERLYHYITFIDIGARAKTILSFILTFVAIALVVLLIGWIVRKIIHLAMLGWADRLLGAAVGGFKAVVIIWLAVISINHLPETKLKKTLTSSHSYQLLNGIPLHLRIPSIPHLDELKKGDPKDFVDTFDNARLRLQTMRNKVDSLKKQTESLQGAYSKKEL